MKNNTVRNICAAIAFVAVTISGILIGCVIYSSGEVISDINESAHTESPEVPEPLDTVPEPKYTEDDLFCMAAAIYNEAGGDACSDDTRRLIGYVILNRVNDSRFPNTVRQVLEAPKQYGTFSETGVKFASRSSHLEEKSAVNRAYKIAEEVLSVDIIPIPSTVLFASEYELGVGLYVYQDGFYFCFAKEVN